jgi:hypothetical protein
MAKLRKSQDENDPEKLAKALLSTPHKPREEVRSGKRKAVQQLKDHREGKAQSG